MSDTLKGQRQLHVKVKTAKGRKSSSTRWLQRQLNDPYVQKAQQEGYRSRAAYKLEEIDDKYRFLKPGANVIDLGAAPGGWLQIAKNRVKNGTVIGLDLLPIEPLPDTDTLVCDFTTDEGLHELETLIEQKKLKSIDVIMTDMAPSACGHTQTDHIRIVLMCELVLDFVKQHLSKDGTFLAKMFQGGTEKELLDDIKKHFKTVKHIKPDASRKESSEMYLIATGFKHDKRSTE